jgi:short-subunit dehydrogenase
MSKTILITGTSSGLGKLTTITLSKEGHSVIAAMHRTKERMRPLQKNLRHCQMQK